MSELRELDITAFADEDTSGVMDAVDNASDQGLSTWLTVRGKRVAAIVPVDAAEYYERAFTGITVTGRHRRAAATAPEASG